jgi:hypothetical protein
MLFRVKRDGFTWQGMVYAQGEILEIDENHERIPALVNQSHIIEYANCEMPDELQGTLVGTPKIVREVIHAQSNPSKVSTSEVEILT